MEFQIGLAPVLLLSQKEHANFICSSNGLLSGGTDVGKKGINNQEGLELHAQRERGCARAWPLGVQFTVEMQLLIVDVDDGKIVRR